MANTKAPVSFDEIIQADRKRRQNEQLANEIFGRNKQSNDSRNQNRKPAQTPSLASRVGVAKRSSSSNNVKPQKNNPFNPPSRPSSAASQIARTNRIASAVNNAHQTNVVTPEAHNTGPGLSIKGTAGPWVVEASNFAPGTTAADIESALQSLVTGSDGTNGLDSVRIKTHNPTVIAEMVFTEKQIADTVISTFNNQKADGRILHVRLSRSGPGSVPNKQSRSAEQSSSTETASTSTNKDLFGDSNGNAPIEDVEMATDPAPAAYDNSREAANQDRQNRDSRRAEPDVQDGRYGFGSTTAPERTTSDATPTQPSVLRDDRSGGSSRRDDDRDRERDRDRGRDRRYDDSRYDRRDDRSYPRNDRGGGGGYGSRQSHYGNGVRGGGYPSGGRMYSDEMMRGGRGGGGPRGGFRGYR